MQAQIQTAERISSQKGAQNMKEYENNNCNDMDLSSGHYYLIKHLTLITGLTDRTIRNYLNMGILQGDKINGLWHFTPEQVEEFLRHPAVRPSILAKHNALIYDFLAESKKPAAQICITLDLPDVDKKSVAQFFCYRINHGDFHQIHFSFDVIGTMARIILKGDPAEVMTLINEYYQQSNIDNSL